MNSPTNKPGTHHRDEFAEILAAYAAGHVVNWKSSLYRLTGPVEDPNVTCTDNQHACGLFHADSEEETTPEVPGMGDCDFLYSLCSRSGDSSVYIRVQETAPVSPESVNA